MPRRLTNDLLLVLVLGLVLSGLIGWAWPVRDVTLLYDLHRVLGAAVLIVLVVWKRQVILASLRRRLKHRDSSTWPSLIALVGLSVGILIGLLWTLHVISFDTLWGYSPLNIHV